MIRDPPNCQDHSEYQGPFEHQGRTLTIRGPPNRQGHSECHGPSDSEYQGPLIFRALQWAVSVRLGHLNLARTGGLVHAPEVFFEDSEKAAARSAAGFWGFVWGKPCATLVEMNCQIRSRSCDVIRGTTFGKVTTEIVFYRNLT